jgi:hypothetical protein
MLSTAVSVSTAATALVSQVRDHEQVAQVHNNDASATVFVGGSDVTTANGFPIPAGEYRAFALRPGDTLYGIAAAGTIAVRVIRRRD